MELQKLFVTLALKADEFKKGLQDAGQQAEGLRSRIGGALGTVGAVGRAAFLGVGAAAVGGFANRGHRAGEASRPRRCWNRGRREVHGTVPACQRTKQRR